jgi:hypothetical protein
MPGAAQGVGNTLLTEAQWYAFLLGVASSPALVLAL